MRRERTTVFSLNKIFAVVIAAVIVLAIGIYGSYRVQANHALRQAKDIVFSLKILAIYSQSDNYEIFDSSSATGLTERAEKELASLIHVSEGINLIEWDSDKGVPTELTYAYKQCFVTYKLADDHSKSWAVEYRLPIIRFG